MTKTEVLHGLRACRQHLASRHRPALDEAIRLLEQPAPPPAPAPTTEALELLDDSLQRAEDREHVQIIFSREQVRAIRDVLAALFPLTREGQDYDPSRPDFVPNAETMAKTRAALLSPSPAATPETPPSLAEEQADTLPLPSRPSFYGPCGFEYVPITKSERDSIVESLKAKWATPDAIREENARLREALEFYADPWKFREPGEDAASVPDFYDEMDFGDKARAALAALSPPPAGGTPKRKRLVDCDRRSPPEWTDHWREWHRGHGCKLDPDAQPPADAAPAPVTTEGEQAKRVTDFAVSLLGSQLCERHQAEARTMPFDEFVQREKAAGCSWCASASAPPAGTHCRFDDVKRDSRQEAQHRGDQGDHDRARRPGRDRP